MIVPGSALAAGALAFILVALLTEVMRRVAIRHRLLDQPRGDGRHSLATPYLGGLAIAGGTVGAFTIAAPPAVPDVWRSLAPGPSSALLA